MFRSKKYSFLFFLLFFGLGVFAQDQEAQLVLSKNKLILGETYSITLLIKNSEKRQINKFPEIQGFNKLTSSSGTSVEKGVVIQKITQNYQATKEGIYKLLPFVILVNGQEIKSDGATITVSNLVTEKMPVVFIDPVDDAFLELYSSKNAVFVGQGFTINLSFLVAKNNTAEMDFDDLEAQIQAILLKIKPKNCWEDNHFIKELKPKDVLRKGKKYVEYELIKTTFYSLNAGIIKIPDINLKMVKYRIDKNNSGAKQKAYKTFSVAGLSFKVKELPEHPLKQKVSVGVFKLQEKITKNTIQTGSTLSYEAKIIGQGNVSLLNLPVQENDNNFDFYSPTTSERKYLSSGELIGEKQFAYNIVAKSAGNHSLDKYFKLIYFNTSKEEYDTLKSTLTLQVSGQNVVNNISTNTENTTSIYENIGNLDTSKSYFSFDETVKQAANILLILLIFGSLYLFDFKKKQ